MLFEEYLREGKISDEDIKKAKKAGIETAKEIFKKDFDEKKAEKMIDDIIEKNKDKVDDEEHLSALIINSFRAGAK